MICASIYSRPIGAAPLIPLWNRQQRAASPTPGKAGINEGPGRCGTARSLHGDLPPSTRSRTRLDEESNKNGDQRTRTQHH